MFSFMRFSHLVDVIRRTKASKSIADIERAAVEIAGLFGYAPTAALVVAVVEAARNADYNLVLKATSDLLLDIRSLLTGSPRMATSSGEKIEVPAIDEQHKVSVCTVCEKLSAELV